MSEKYAERDPEEEIRKAFQLFDDDHTGKISLRNMKRVARELGENLSEEELQNMIDEFDRDQDGEISAEEFLYIMKQSTMYVSSPLHTNISQTNPSFFCSWCTHHTEHSTSSFLIMNTFIPFLYPLTVQ